MTAATTAPVEPATRGQGDRFRGDIQGLRAVAVVLVLLYHGGLPWVPGGYVGVDVFFVISGFLITGLILREVRSTGRLSLAGFWARRVRRLLPATAVTFVGVALLTVLVLPVTRWATVAGDMVASTLYVVNWRLADRSVDYLAQGQAASPLQHFWSLAVEEQFYVVWPLLIVALLWWARRGAATGGVVTRRLGWGLVVLSAPSLAWSVWLTSAEPGPAYFVTTTRLWELAIGALLAVGAQRASRVPVPVRAAAGWIGMAMILAAAVLFTAQTPFPGAAALLPTVGAAAVLWAGTGDGTARVRGLSLPVMQGVGALSYSLYLWHWPLLIAAAAHWGGEDGQLRISHGLLVVTAAVVPAWLTYRLVELPLHRSPALARPARAAVVGAVCIALGLGAAGAIHLATPRSEPEVVEAEGRDGALALGDDPSSSPAGEVVDAVGSITPSPVAAVEDNADVYDDGCHQEQGDPDVLSCTYGEPGGDVTVALVGDSHAAQWQPALREVAVSQGWRLETYTKSACFFGDALVWLASDGRPYTDCREWTDGVVEQLRAAPPDVVVVSLAGVYETVEEGEGQDGGEAGAAARRQASRPVLAEGLARTWRELVDAGSRLVVIRDTPSMGQDMPECVAEHLTELSACAIDRDEAVARSAAGMLTAAADQVPQARTIDLTGYVCPREQCAPVIGGVLVFRDTDHLTATYARTLAPALGRELSAVLDE